MRYVIVDLDGASRGHYSTRGAVRDALRDAEQDHPGIAEELYVTTYDDDRARVGKPERGDELLAEKVVISETTFDWSEGEGEDETTTETRVLAGASGYD